MTSHEPTLLEYTYANHIAKLLADREALAILSTETRMRREELLQAVQDPLGYGHQGRVAINSAAERQIDFYDGIVAFYVVRKKPVPTEARFGFLLTHGYYTHVELSMVSEFSQNYYKELMLEDSKKFLEEDFQKVVLEAVSSVLDQKDEFFKGDKEASAFLEETWKKWQENHDALSLQEKNQMLCAMLAFLQNQL